MNKLKDKLNKSIQEYVCLFCKKHDIEFDYWVSDLPGTVGTFGDYFFGFEDIRLDLETNQPEDEIFKWYDLSLEMAMKGQSGINYYSWIKGNHPEKDVFKDVVYDIKERFGSITYDTNMCDLGDIGNEIGIVLKKYIEDGKMGFKLKDFINGVNHGVDLINYKEKESLTEINHKEKESLVVFWKINCSGGKVFSVVSNDKFFEYINYYVNKIKKDEKSIDYKINYDIGAVEIFVDKENTHYLYFGDYELNKF